MSSCKKLANFLLRVQDDADFACMTQSLLIEALLRISLPELWIEYVLPYISLCVLSISASHATYDMPDGVIFIFESFLDRTYQYFRVFRSWIDN